MYTNDAYYCDTGTWTRRSTTRRVQTSSTYGTGNIGGTTTKGPTGSLRVTDAW
jgi:hypothetical protein